MSDISKLISLSPKEKRKLLFELLQEKAKKATASYPLSYGQKALWFLYQSAPESAAYNVAFTSRIQGNCDVATLRHTFQTLIGRHPSLRTTFQMKDGEPVQIVHGYQELYFEEIDARAWTKDELNKRVREAYQRPFNLEEGPVVRVHLFSLSSEEHVLLLCAHHIVGDAWSLWILLDEWRQLYLAETVGIQASLPPLELNYTDFVRWQDEMLDGPTGEKLWNYWRKQLTGELPVLDLPADHSRPPVQSFRGASLPFKLENNLTQQLKDLTQAEGATLYMTLLAAFQVLLHRYTGQEDILVGSPTMGRSHPKFARIVGYFVNPVVLQANLAGNPEFKQFLNQVRHTVLATLEHQDYPFPLLVERLLSNRDLSRSPLFQVMFVLQKPQQAGEILNLLTGETNVDWGGLSLSPFELAQQEGQFDLTLEMVEAQESLFGIFKYNTDLFDVTTIKRMVGHFQTLLEGIVANPFERISELPLLTATERHQLLVEWNNTLAEYPHKCIHEFFEEQVKRTPEAYALVVPTDAERGEDKQLTYRELNARSNQLAHHLQALGVGPEVLVGICIERSLEMVVGLLGVLKAGGAYVPLEPAYPAERLAFMLEDAQLSVLLTQEKLVAGLPSHGAHVVCLDTDYGVISQQSEENPISRGKPDNLAYVIYTSGSTGRPKGVQISHNSVANFLNSMRLRPGLTAQDIFLAVTTISFDIAALELYLPLMVGAQVVLVSREVASDGSQLLDLLVNSGATAMQATPATWHLLLATGWPGNPRLKILCGGEALSQQLANQLVERGRSVCNLYGPTETTIWSTAYEVENQRLVTGSKKAPQSIGRPIANTELYILDHYLQPVPIGVPGELHIGGTGLARGYLNRPKLTAEKFITNSFSDGLIYKTGDKARYLPDGNIEFLGRLDHQVKIRGFRIELSEIEAVLGQHPAVRETVVIVQEDPSDNMILRGGKRLVAYVVPNQEPPTNSELRRFVNRKLPDYMVPSAFVMLTAWPLTPNGKVDRRALPTSDTFRQGLEKGFVSPRTSIEKFLATSWAEILGVEQISINDNFFELGGHSLLATQFIFRLREALSVKLPLRSLFESPTVAGLAQVIEVVQRQGLSAIKTTTAFVNLDAEAVLDPTIVPPSPFVQRVEKEPAAIFLTGATGFLGAFILYELLQQTQAKIYCLVRSSNAQSGQQRIQSNLKCYQILDEHLSDRIIPIPGDLSLPLMGLSRETFQTLTDKIEVVYHNGALVNFTYPYSKLKAANVLGTQEVLRLASQTKVKPVHFVSTVSVFDSVDHTNVQVVREQDDLPNPKGIYGGYAQSKWVAEKLVASARDRGIPVCIYRPEAITGHSETGAWNTDDAVCRTIRGVIQLGKIPNLDPVVGMLPVDYVAKAIVHLSQQEKSRGQIFHLINPQPLRLSQIADWIRAIGYPLEQISVAKWQEELVQLSRSSRSTPLYPLMPLFFEEVFEGVTLFETLSQRQKFEYQNTLNGLADTDMVCPSVKALLGTYFSYLISNGFLEEPPPNFSSQEARTRGSSH